MKCILLFGLFVLSFLLQVSPCSDSNEERDKALFAAEEAIYLDGFGERGFVALKPWIINPGDNPGRVVALIARYYAQSCGNDEKAVEELTALMLPEDLRQNWLVQQRESYRTVLEEWKRQCATARRVDQPQPLPPPFIQAQIPGVDTWRLKAETAEAALELSRHLLAAQRPDEAGLVVDAVLALSPGFHRFLALELGAELKAKNGDLTGALQLVRLALRNLDISVRYTGSSDEGRQLNRREKALKLRLSKFASELERRIECERYGEGFVRYRAAEQRRLRDEEMGEAILMYRNIEKEFPGTIWSEAAHCYRIKALIQLTSDFYIEKHRVSISEHDRSIARLISRIESAKVEKVPPPAMARLEQQVEREKKYLETLKAIPTEKNAAREIYRAGDLFVRANPIGLYREETSYDLARYALDRDVDLAVAKRRLLATWTLISRVSSADYIVAKLNVPEQAQAVSAPPTERDRRTSFGRIIRNDIAIGAVVNRQTALWYLDNLRQRICLELAFLFFVENKPDAAQEWLEKVPAGLDLDTGLDGSIVTNQTRVAWAIKHGYIFAHPQELILYTTDQQRLAVLLADFLYITKEYARCHQLHLRLLNNEFGKLTDAQRDYPLLAIAWCRYRGAFSSGEKSKGINERFINDCEQVLNKRDGTYSELRAAYIIGQAAMDAGSKQVQSRGKLLLEEVAASALNDRIVYNARLAVGIRYMRENDQKRGLDMLRKFPATEKDYRASGLALIAQFAPDQLTPQERKIVDEK